MLNVCNQVPVKFFSETKIKKTQIWRFKMKRLSALLIGAFMLVSANSVMAIEGDQNLPTNSAINAAMSTVSDQRLGDFKTLCGDLPSAADGEGVNIERVCVKTWESENGKIDFKLPDFENPNY